MERINDIVEINQMLALYGHAIDRGLWGRLDEVYAEDGEYHSATSGAHVGRAAVVAYLKQAVMPMHHGTNIFIEFDERPHHATGMVKFLCVHANASVTTGDYADEYVRTATDGGSCAAPAAS